MLAEILIVAALILLNGALAMSELAVVSSRPARLKPMAESGSSGAAAALKLAEDPGRFLSTVQIGITLVGVLSGAFSGATLGARLSGWLAAQGLSAQWSDTLGVGGVVVLLTYLSLIVGELVPKQIALKNPEAVAARVAPAMILLARIGAPLVWLLDVSGRLLLALLGQTRRRQVPRHRRRGAHPAGRGALRRHHRDRRAGDALGRHAPGRPLRPRADDAAPRCRTARSRRDAGRNAAPPSAASPARASPCATPRRTRCWACST